jgi:two-component system cell cycle sensor histidine kinase/response regulator CckA
MGSEQDDSATINWKGSRQSENRLVSLKKLPLPGDPDTIILLMADITERVRNEEALRDYQHHLEALIEERTADLKRTSERLLQAQKMEAIGIITSGVAHDLNNILTGIVAYPDLLLMEIPDNSPLKKLALSIQESGQRAAAVVQDLLTMARRGVSSNEVVNVNTVVTEYLNSPECDKLKSFHPKIDFRTELADGLFNIL